jgi:hypothetical protein
MIKWREQPPPERENPTNDDLHYQEVWTVVGMFSKLLTKARAEGVDCSFFSQRELDALAEVEEWLCHA